MAERYGGDAAAWAEANRQIVGDWDSYYADLDLAGDDGVNHMWEGQFRVTRALFRLTNTLEPDQAELTALSRELPYLATRACGAFFPDARDMLPHLQEIGYRLGIASHTTTLQARGTLEGGGVLDLFTGPILGPDVTGHFVKNKAFYLASNLPTENVLVVDDSLDGVRGAKAAGMKAAYLRRDGQPKPSPADHTLLGDLRGLLDVLNAEK
jgi:FMN phosphatase YigB (HAD superfamily)